MLDILSNLIIDNNQMDKYLYKIKQKVENRSIQERPYNHHQIESLKKISNDITQLIDKLANLFIEGQIIAINDKITKENINGFKKNLINIYEAIAGIETLLSFNLLDENENKLWNKLIYLSYTNAYMHELIFDKEFITEFGVIPPPTDYITEGKRIMEAKNRFRVFV